jgi:hypothetical protein
MVVRSRSVLALGQDCPDLVGTKTLRLTKEGPTKGELESTVVTRATLVVRYQVLPVQGTTTWYLRYVVQRPTEAAVHEYCICTY